MRRSALYLLSVLTIGTGAYLANSLANRSENIIVIIPQNSNAESKSDCSLIEKMPPLENPEAVRCTDNSSQKLVINVWDQNHDDPLVQNKIKTTIEEVVAKWDVQLVAREGFQGLESYLSEDIKLPYSLSDLERKGLINIGIDPLCGYWNQLLNLEMDSWGILERARKQADACYKKSNLDSCYRLDQHEELKELMKKLKKEVEKVIPLAISEDIRQFETLGLFLWGLSDYVAYPLRSYATTEGIVEIMDTSGLDTAILSYGAAHALQINEYLDYLGISHIDIILNETLFDQRMERLKQTELNRFSLKSLKDYKQKMLGIIN